VRSKFLTPLLRSVRTFVRARAGNTAVVFALGAPALLGCGALALDFSNAFSARSSLQQAADSAALAATRELQLRSTSDRTVRSIVDEYVRQHVDRDVQITAVSSAVLDRRQGVRVQLSAHVPSMMGRLVNPDGFSPSVTAVARLSAGAPLCALALEQRAANAIQLVNRARMMAPNCAVVSNSTSSRGIAADNNSEMVATQICSAGGASGMGSNYTPQPIEDCPPIEDPLANRPEPNASGCDHLLVVQVIGSQRLRPGVYCAGITVLPGATARLDPGIYVIKNGPLLVMNGGTLRGQNTGFYFVGDLSVMNFAQGSIINLTAPKDGPMAGFLFFANRVLLTGDLNLRHFRINSDNARNLLGTIYLRDGVLDVDANRPIADQSAYTVIVARRINVRSGPDLVLNTNYEGTDVPVPEGVGPRNSSAFLAQ
jgi:Flp pilus assembly protein TadG